MYDSLGLNAESTGERRSLFMKQQAGGARRGAGLFVACGLMLGAAVSFAVAPSRAETADPSSLPSQPGAPTPTCEPQLGVPNTWEQMGPPIVLDGIVTDTLKASAYRSSVDPTRPCVMYRTAEDTRALERSTDGGATFRRVFFDDRTAAATGRPMHITGVYTPAADVVYLSEDGNGTAVVRSLDAGATWQPANAGLEGQAIRKLWFAPSDPEVGYAAAQTGNSIAFYGTRNGGRQWTRLQGANSTTLLQGDDSYTITVDPGDKAHLIIGFQGTASIFGSDPPAGSLLLESRDYGQSFTPVRVPYQAVEILFARRQGNALRLYVIANGSRPETNKDNGVFYSDDAEGGWRESQWHVVPMFMRTTWWGGLVDPVTPDKVLYFGSPYFEAPSRLFAMYTRNGFQDQELANQPEVRNAHYAVTQYRADRFGQFYIDVGFNCRHNPCPGGVKDNNKGAWVTLRFRPPDPGQARKISTEEDVPEARTGSYRQAHSCRVTPQPPLYSTGSDDGGSLAFDGTRLYYTRRGEQGPDPYSAVIRVADPTTCEETGRLVVHFDPATYQAARKRAISDTDGATPLLPERPSIDSVAYDQVHDELWFSVMRTGPFVQPYNGDPDGSPFPVWAAPRHGAGIDRQAELRFWDNPCGLGGIGLMAHDRVSDTLFTCDRKIPGERTRAGKSLVTCLHPLFQGFTSGSRDVWDIQAWGGSLPGTLIALNGEHGNAIAQYDVRTCTHLDEWSPALLQNVPKPRQGPDFASLQLVCDAVTFRDRLGGAPAPSAVAWMRSGADFTAYRISPDAGPGLVCPWPTVLRYSGDTGVDPGQRFQACMTVTVPKTDGPIPGVPVRISVAGQPVITAVSGRDGRACVAHDVPSTAAQGGRLSVTGEVVQDLHLLASSAVGSVLVGQIPPPPPAPPPVIIPPPKPVPPPVPLLPAPAPAPAPAAVQPVVPAPGQVVAQQGLAGEKEKEVQLAHAQQESKGEASFAAEPAAESSTDYEFAAALVGVLALGAVALGLSVGRSGLSPEPELVLAHERSITHRRRRRGIR